jgi:hypothetical protein
MGDTVADLEERNDQQALERAVRDWLTQAIAGLEAQDGQVCKQEGSRTNEPVIEAAGVSR